MEVLNDAERRYSRKTPWKQCSQKSLRSSVTIWEDTEERDQGPKVHRELPYEPQKNQGRMVKCKSQGPCGEHPQVLSALPGSLRPYLLLM
jgi:hypothetical protein